MADVLASSISILALAVSVVTAWLTLFRRGTVKMTRPTMIFFGPDGRKFKGAQMAPPKVYLRTLLFSTSKRGRIVESMHVRLSRNESHQNFNFWVHGEEKLFRGSGLFVGDTGVATNHHFMTPRDGTSFRFVEGRYRLEVFAHLLGDKSPKLLFSHELEITKEFAAQLEKPEAGLFFDWGPDSSRYLAHIDLHPSRNHPEDFLLMLSDALVLEGPSAGGKAAKSGN